MRNALFPKLAFSNLKKQYRIYIPYMLACIGSIMMFYNFCHLTFDAATGYGNLAFVMSLGVVVIGLFSVIFLFYTNSFIIKRRTKEFGLYNILGMEKKHIARIVSLECLYTSLSSLILGLGLGILLNKLMLLALRKLLHFDVQYGFTISPISIVITLVLFAGIFALTLVRNLYQIARAKPIDLLQSGNVGEKEPKTKWIMAVLGVICLGIGYYISLTTQSPIAAIALFFLAVILVIIGTYLLFTAGSIAALKLLRKNKRYYYQTRHFTTISGMLYRMKQNAAGLASICILSTMVLVMLSSTTSLYFGMEDALRTRYPRNIVFTARSISDENVKHVDEAVVQVGKEFDTPVKDPVTYRSAFIVTEMNKGHLTPADRESFTYTTRTTIIELMLLKDYERMSGNTATLSDNECLLYKAQGENPVNPLWFGDTAVSIQRELDDLLVESPVSAMLVNHYYVIVSNEQVAQALYTKLSPDGTTFANGRDYYYGFDVRGDEQTQLVIASRLRELIQVYRVDNFTVETVAGSREDFLTLYGGLFFLGIFLGLLFIMATVLIIYYKQISEGYDDRERFQIMQKVGMSKQEVRHTIKSQVLTVFFLPLITAAIHIAASFPFVSKMLMALNLNNIPLFGLCTIGAMLLFAVLYTAVYLITARSYYKIVEAK